MTTTSAVLSFKMLTEPKAPRRMGRRSCGLAVLKFAFAASASPKLPTIVANSTSDPLPIKDKR